MLIGLLIPVLLLLALAVLAVKYGADSRVGTDRQSL